MCDLTKLPTGRPKYHFFTNNGTKCKRMQDVTNSEKQNQVHKRQLFVVSNQRQINYLSRTVNIENKQKIEALSKRNIELVNEINEFKEMAFKTGTILTNHPDYVEYIKSDIPVLAFEMSAEFKRLQIYSELEKMFEQDAKTVLDFIEDLFIEKCTQESVMAELDIILDAMGYRKSKKPQPKQKLELA